MTTTPPAAPHPFPFDDMSAPAPAPALAAISTAEPVARVDTPTGVPAWLVSRPDDVRRVLTDERFSRAAHVAEPARSDFGIPQVAGGMAATHGPGHTRLRKLVDGAFTTRRAEGLRPFVRRGTEALPDTVEAAGPGADIVTLLATPLPVMTVCEWIGVPCADRDAFLPGTETLLNVSAYGAEELTGRRDAVINYLAGPALKRQADPAGDLISELVAISADGDRLTGPEPIGLLVLLLGAGLETSARQIALDLLDLFQHPDQWDLLAEDPSRCAGAVEELLRHTPTVPASPPRPATGDTEVAGVTIRAGEVVMTAFATANRDPGARTAPDRLDVLRPTPPHVSFGHGVHRCLGAPVARVVLQEALAGLVLRFPGLRLAVPRTDIVRRTGHAARGPERLPVTW